MMDAADWDGVFVADLAAERARLGKANVVRFGGRAAADDAGLRGDEFAVLLVAQTDGLRRKAASDDCRCGAGRLRTVEGSALFVASSLLGLSTACRCRERRPVLLDRCEPLPEAGLDSFRIGGRSACSLPGGFCGPSRRPRRRIGDRRARRPVGRAAPPTGPRPTRSSEA